MSISESVFEESLHSLRIPAAMPVAVGVSGGPDSMALLWLLSRWGLRHGVEIHAFTVDHGLRAEAAAEAAQVGVWISSWANVHHNILRWDGDKPESRILEAAREARYRLMAEAAITAGAKFLFIAHHRDDQAETLLLRLSAGSGLDGLCGMAAVKVLHSGISLVRPLLDYSKVELVALCVQEAIPFVEDPTNRNADYARPRLRAAQDILEEEGLSSKRLSVMAKRMARAKSALDDFAHDLFTHAVTEAREDGFLFHYKALHAAHEELVLRVFLKVMDELHPESDYGPRLERVEHLVQRIFKGPDFKGATLGGCIFALKDKNETLWIGRE